MINFKILTTGCLLGISLMITMPVLAEDNIDYKTHFQVSSAIVYNETDNNNLIHVVDNSGSEYIELFTSKPVEEVVYTTVRLNLRTVPTTNSTPVMVLPKNGKLVRVGDSGEYGWDIVQIAGVNYFVWNEYLTTEVPDGEITEITQVKKTSSYSSSPSSSSSYTSATGVGENAAKEEIARRESGGDYNAVSASGKYIGRYQLTNSYLNGDYSPENQERVADEYVRNRYGSWENALNFWNNNGWY